MKQLLIAPKQMSWRTHVERPNCSSKPPKLTIPCHEDKQAISNQPNQLSQVIPRKPTPQEGSVTSTRQHRRTHHLPTHRLAPDLREKAPTSWTIPSHLSQYQSQLQGGGNTYLHSGSIGPSSSHPCTLNATPLPLRQAGACDTSTYKASQTSD